MTQSLPEPTSITAPISVNEVVAPRQLQPEQIASLQALSRQVMSQLELHLAARSVSQTNLTLTAVSCGVGAAVGETFAVKFTPNGGKVEIES